MSDYRATDTTYQPREHFARRRDEHSAPYLEWRERRGRGLYCCDVDCVEYRYIDGRLLVVGLTEATDCDTRLEAPGLLSAIWDRLDPKRDGMSAGQTRTLYKLAKAAGVPAWAVVMEFKTPRFAVRRLDKRTSTWSTYDEAAYDELLLGLPGWPA